MNWFVANEGILQNTLMYAILAIGLQVAMRAGVFSLISVGCWGFGGYAIGILVQRGWGMWTALLVALVAAAAVSYALARLLVRLHGVYLAMATLAFNAMIGIVAIEGGELTGGAQGLFGIQTSVNTLQVTLLFLVVVALAVTLERRSVGRAFTLIREDEQLAQSQGLDARRYQRFAFVLSGVVGAVSGSLNVGLIGYIGPGDAGFRLVVLALSMVVIGGVDSWRGAVIGAALLTWLPIWLQGLEQWWDLAYGGLLVVLAVYAPGGIYGGLRWLIHRVRRRPTAQPVADAEVIAGV